MHYRLQSIILALICLMASAGFWYYLPGVLTFQTEGLDMRALVMSVIFFTLHLICIGIFFVVQGEKHISLVISVISPLLLFVGVAFHPVLIVAYIGLVLVYKFGFTRTENASHMQITKGISGIIEKGMPLLLTALSLALSLVYFAHTRAIPPEISARDLVPDVVISGILRNPLTSHFDTATFELGEFDTNEMIPGIKEDIIQEDLLDDVVLGQLDAFLEPLKAYIPIAFAIAFFLFLRTVAFPYGWFILASIWVSIRILRALNIIVLKQRPAIRNELFWK